MREQILTFSDSVDVGGFYRFKSVYSKEEIVLEVTARQTSEPVQGADSSIYVQWEISRGLAEVSPIIPRLGLKARSQYVIVFEGRESAVSRVWYCAEARDIHENTRLILGSGKTPKLAFDNYMERIATLLSTSQEDFERAKDYGPEVGDMRTLAGLLYTTE
jgi:hypothetical protein